MSFCALQFLAGEEEAGCKCREGRSQLGGVPGLPRVHRPRAALAAAAGNKEPPPCEPPQHLPGWPGGDRSTGHCGCEAGTCPSRVPALIFPEQEHGISSAGAGAGLSLLPEGLSRAQAQALLGEDAPKSRDFLCGEPGASQSLGTKLCQLPAVQPGGKIVISFTLGKSGLSLGVSSFVPIQRRNSFSPARAFSALSQL